MAFVQDLPPSESQINQVFMNYLQQIINSPNDAAANPKKLMTLVAFFETENPRFFAVPPKVAQPLGYSDAQQPVDASSITRADTALFVSYTNKQAQAVGWSYILGRHSSLSVA